MYTYMSQFFAGVLDPTWPHVLLIGGSLIGGALVGLGVILEAHKFWSLPTLSVFVGIIIEAICTLLLFGFDEGISSKQQSIIEAQQDKIIALETKLAPRELTDKQLETITALAKQFAPQQYTLSVAVGSEPTGLVCKVDAALKKAGWLRHVSTDLIKTQPFCDNEDWEVGINLLSDIHIRVSLDADAFVQGAAMALAGSLKLADIEVRPEKAKTVKDNTIVAVMIGAKL